MAILAALGSSAIHRLKRSFDLTSSKALSLLEQLKLLMSPAQNF